MKLRALVPAIFLCSLAQAQVNCQSEDQLAKLEIRVIDTFVDKTAFISHEHFNHVHENAISVTVHESPEFVDFINEDKDFSLRLNLSPVLSPWKSIPVYKAEFKYGPVSSETSCTLD